MTLITSLSSTHTLQSPLTPLAAYYQYTLHTHTHTRANRVYYISFPFAALDCNHEPLSRGETTANTLDDSNTLNESNDPNSSSKTSNLNSPGSHPPSSSPSTSTSPATTPCTTLVLVVPPKTVVDACYLQVEEGEGEGKGEGKGKAEGEKEGKENEEEHENADSNPPLPCLEDMIHSDITDLLPHSNPTFFNPRHTFAFPLPAEQGPFLCTQVALISLITLITITSLTALITLINLVTENPKSSNKVNDLKPTDHLNTDNHDSPL